MTRLLRFIVIAILLALTLGLGLCSALGVSIAAINWIDAIKGMHHTAEYRDLAMIFLLLSVPGLLVALLCGWLAMRLWRGRLSDPRQ